MFGIFVFPVFFNVFAFWLQSYSIPNQSQRIIGINAVSLSC